MLIAFWRWPFVWWWDLTGHLLIYRLDEMSLIKGVRVIPWSFIEVVSLFSGRDLAFVLAKPILEERFAREDAEWEANWEKSRKS